jgi:hypothetical protein
MPRRTLASACLAVAATLVGLLPALVGRAAASSCSAWTSESAPPATIRVFRHATGTIDTVSFKPYVKNVLSREWIGSWTAQSLQSGALIVRNYAWYQVLHWRGGVDDGGACFDLRDDTWDQVYDPSQPTWSTAAAAVDATWGARVYRDGHVFPTYYNAGAVNEACGANANGWKAYQWGTQACGLSRMSAGQIVLKYYYPGVTVTGLGAPTPTPSPSPTPTARPTATPAPRPTPTPTPQPTATPTPRPSASATAKPSPSPTPHPSPTPSPTVSPKPTATPTRQPSPTPSPFATALPAPPANQQLPGGGQSNLTNSSAPPPPPLADPTPVVATKNSAPLEGPLETGGRIATGADLDVLLSVLDASAADALPVDSSAMNRSTPDPRLLLFRDHFGDAVEAFVSAVASELGGGRAIAELARP